MQLDRILTSAFLIEYLRTPIDLEAPCVELEV